MPVRSGHICWLLVERHQTFSGGRKAAAIIFEHIQSRPVGTNLYFSHTNTCFFARVPTGRDEQYQEQDNGHHGIAPRINPGQFWW